MLRVDEDELAVDRRTRPRYEGGIELGRHLPESLLPVRVGRLWTVVVAQGRDGGVGAAACGKMGAVVKPNDLVDPECQRVEGGELEREAGSSVGFERGEQTAYPTGGGAKSTRGHAVTSRERAFACRMRILEFRWGRTG